MGGRPGGPAEPATAPAAAPERPQGLQMQPAMDRLEYELAATRERLMRLQANQNDIAMDLPHSVAMPDGEELPYSSSLKMKFRDPEQENEIVSTCIRPPPNKTVFDGESPPPYRSNSSGFLSSDWSSESSCGSLVRSNSVSGESKKPSSILGITVKCLRRKSKNRNKNGKNYNMIVQEPSEPLSVNVPISTQRLNRLSAFSENAVPSSSVSSVPTVQCAPSAAEGHQALRFADQHRLKWNSAGECSKTEEAKEAKEGKVGKEGKGKNKGEKNSV